MSLEQQAESVLVVTGDAEGFAVRSQTSQGQLTQTAEGLLKASAVTLFGALLIAMTLLIHSVESGVSSDIVADWVLRSAVDSSMDLTTGILELAEVQGVSYVGEATDVVVTTGRAHPRTPAAVLLMSPLLLVEWNSVYEVWLIVNAVGFLVLGALTVVVAPKRRRGLVIALLPLAPAMVPVWRALEFGAHSAWLAGLIWAFLWATRDRDDAYGGVALGIAMGIRLFPGLLLISAIRHRRWKAVVSAVTTAIALNAAGLLYGSVSIQQSVENLQRAAEQWGGFISNGSLAAVFLAVGVPWGWSVVVSVGLGVIAADRVSRRLSYLHASMIVVLVAVFVSPLSWEHYDVFFIPAVLLVIATSGSKYAKTLGVSCVAFWVGTGLAASFGFVVEVSQTFVIASGRALAAAALYAAARTGPEPDDIGRPLNALPSRVAPAGR